MGMGGTAALVKLTSVKAVQFTVGTPAAALAATPVGGGLAEHVAAGLAYLQCDPGNAVGSTIKLGDANGQFWSLSPGDVFPFALAIADLGLVWALGSVGGLLLNAIITQ